MTWFTVLVRRAAGHLVLAAVLVGAVAGAQSPATFDAVSIKLNRTGAEASETETTPGRLRLTNATPFSIIRRAFGVQDTQIIDAPAWAMTERYDIIAVTAGREGLSDRDRQEYLQTMLADRWQFKFHRDTRELRVYSLVPARAGTTLVPHAGPGEYAMKVEPSGARVVLRSTRGNMTRLAEILSRFTGALVTNDTALTGEYDFTLDWTQDQTADVAGPSLFTALQEQLGLRLEAARKPFPVIVVERLMRPSED